MKKSIIINSQKTELRAQVSTAINTSMDSHETMSFTNLIKLDLNSILSMTDNLDGLTISLTDNDIDQDMEKVLFVMNLMSYYTMPQITYTGDFSDIQIDAISTEDFTSLIIELD